MSSGCANDAGSDSLLAGWSAFVQAGSGDAANNPRIAVREPGSQTRSRYSSPGAG